MLREVEGRISGHGKKCGKWPKFRNDLRTNCFRSSHGACLYLSQVSNLHKIDCDPAFGGVVNEAGVGCRTCDPGFTFVKHRGWNSPRSSRTIEAGLGATFSHMQA